MTKKHAFYLLLTITLSTGVAFAQQRPTPPAPPADPDFSVEPFEGQFSFLIDGGYLGVNTEDINRENMSRYGLREPHGVGVTSVAAGSPAEKAGIRKDDVIVRVDGDNVTSVRKLTRLISEIAPDQSVRITISRGGSEQELTATIGKRDEARSFARVFKGSPQVWSMEGHPVLENFSFNFGNGRRIGVSTMQLTKQLADFFGIVDGKGLLVTAVTEDSPAAKAGLKAGDVITAVDGEKIERSGDISRAINKRKDGDVTLTIIRNKSQQTIRVTPKEGDFPFSTPGTTQIGRTIVIPRIELPVIPEINLSIPSIQLPSVPEVNIKLPRITRPVKVRTPRQTRTI
jgi:membrane-associated protease RseP (regulator of RpoE activity)